jgi:hypothetical protein
MSKQSKKHHLGTSKIIAQSNAYTSTTIYVPTKLRGQLETKSTSSGTRLATKKG